MPELIRVDFSSFADVADEIVVDRVKSGEVALFEVLMRRHNRRVFRATRAILKSDDAAEEAMQQAYASAFEHLAQFDGRASFSTWLTRIAANEALGRLRKENRSASMDDGDRLEDRVDVITPSPEQAASDTEIRALIEEAVDRLPLGFRAVFVMRAVEEMSVGETAAALDIPEETVRTRLFRARALLKDALAERLDEAILRVFDFHLRRCDRIVDGVFQRLSTRQ